MEPPSGVGAAARPRRRPRRHPGLSGRDSDFRESVPCRPGSTGYSARADRWPRQRPQSPVAVAPPGSVSPCRAGPSAPRRRYPSDRSAGSPTQPPSAFNEASLIKELEEQGIGRPSTYAETVSTIQKRKYVELEDKKFRPTLLGRIIAGLLVDSFPKLLNTRFTAEMESSLDRIEEGKASWTETLEDFYGPFQSDLQQAKRNMKNVKREGIPTQAKCPDCGEPLLVRSGRYGLFIGCSAYPECGYTQKIAAEKLPSAEPVPTDQKCPECGAPMVIRAGRTGPFMSCSRYPECKATRPVTTGVTCPKCGTGELAQRRTKKGKTFYSCSRYPQCDYSLWYKPVSVACPNPDCDSRDHGGNGPARRTMPFSNAQSARPNLQTRLLRICQLVRRPHLKNPQNR